MLLVDGIPQSHVDLEDPGYLDFEYVRRLGHVIDTAAPEGQPLRVLHLGAGALTLARYVAATRPGSPQLAIDADAALIELVRARLPFRRTDSRGGRIRVRIGDARAELGRLPAGSNVLCFSLAGDGEIDLSLVTKRPGPGIDLDVGHASIQLASLKDADPLPAYVRLIHDVLLGDRSLFTRPDGLAAAAAEGGKRVLDGCGG